MLGAARGFGGVGELPLLGEGVDAGGFASVGSANEGDFGHFNAGELVELRCGSEEAGGVEPVAREGSVGRCGGAGWG